MTTAQPPWMGPNELNFYVPIPDITSGTGDLTPMEMVGINYRYAKLYREGKFDELLDEVMVDVPVFEYYPNRIRLVGRQALRKNWEIKHRGFKDIIDNGKSTVRYSMFGENYYAAEFTLNMPMPDGTRMPWHKMALVSFRKDRMIGEIVYNDHYFAERLEKMMTPEFTSTPGVERF